MTTATTPSQNTPLFSVILKAGTDNDTDNPTPKQIFDAFVALNPQPEESEFWHEMLSYALVITGQVL